ncbi:hypothetical protein Clacol_003473 [Clathrus columnatus]|uniref:Uncharacterized protein n=1 Tax=Clathrus columnatus TaxID=1419009 RepID=A0AAV5A8A3_9AGAM|nr:hypothetical protein Clacol_003473 [Clathrus columnatus]
MPLSSAARGTNTQVLSITSTPSPPPTPLSPLTSNSSESVSVSGSFIGSSHPSMGTVLGLGLAAGIMFVSGVAVVLSYIPIFENYVAEIRLDEKPVQLALWDTAGQEEYEGLRPLSYSKSHVILIAFSVDTPDSLENVTVKWIEEVRSICGSTVPVILVGCKTDLRPPPGSPTSHMYVSTEAGRRVAAEIGARAYKECSALKSEGVDDVFEAATRASMLMREGTKSHTRYEADEDMKARCCCIC